MYIYNIYIYTCTDTHTCIQLQDLSKVRTSFSFLGIASEFWKIVETVFSEFKRITFFFSIKFSVGRRGLGRLNLKISRRKVVFVMQHRKLIWCNSFVLWWLLKAIQVSTKVKFNHLPLSQNYVRIFEICEACVHYQFDCHLLWLRNFLSSWNRGHGPLEGQ